LSGSDICARLEIGGRAVLFPPRDDATSGKRGRPLRENRKADNAGPPDGGQLIHFRAIITRVGGLVCLVDHGWDKNSGSGHPAVANETLAELEKFWEVRNRYNVFQASGAGVCKGADDVVGGIFLHWTPAGWLGKTGKEGVLFAPGRLELEWEEYWGGGYRSFLNRWFVSVGDPGPSI